MTQVTITLPASILVRNVGTESIRLDTGKLSAEVVAKIFEGGAKIILTNVYNGGGKERSEVERVAQLQKKLDAWYRGEYVTVERGESQYTAMREQYAQERLEAAGMSRAEVDKAIRATVTRVFGEKESATFPKFLLAVATEKAKANGKPEEAPAIAEAIEAALAKRTAEAAQKRAELASGLKEVDLGL